MTRRETVCAEAHRVWSSSPRKGEGIITPHSQAPHHQGQKLDENEKDMYGPPEVNRSKGLGSAGHCPLPVYIMDKTLVACWEPVAVEAICKKGKEETVDWKPK